MLPAEEVSHKSPDILAIIGISALFYTAFTALPDSQIVCVHFSLSDNEAKHLIGAGGPAVRGASLAGLLRCSGEIAVPGNTSAVSSDPQLSTQSAVM